jgi:hypothetical protein
MDGLHEGCRAMFFSGSLTAKRNAGMEKVPASSSLLLFVDDDVELHRDYALFACELFASRREIVAASGNVRVDASIPRVRAIAILAEARIPEWKFKWNGKNSVLYGCNMIIQTAYSRQLRRWFICPQAICDILRPLMPLTDF